MSPRKTHLLLAAITFLVTVVFLNKAFHIDDALFIWMAQQIVQHPLDPYGFTVNWVSFPQAMPLVMQNPPLCSYYLAAIGGVFGWAEPTLHAAFLIWPILAVCGTAAVARRFGANPILAGALVLFFPVFLVSATSVMCDMMLLALWIWAIELWLAALDKRHAWLFFLSALLICAATLTKYFGIALVPLLAAYTIMKERRATPALVFLLLPVAIISLYDFVSEQQYGSGLFTTAMGLSAGVSAGTRPSRLAQLLMGLAFSGGCFASALFFLRCRGPLLCAASAAGAILFGVAFKFFICNWVYLTTSDIPIWLEGAVFATLGTGLLVLAADQLRRHFQAETLLLFLWLSGTIFFATFLNWSVTARTLLPMAPAVAILVLQKFGNHRRAAWSLGAAAILSLALAAADYAQANSARAAARSFRKQYAAQMERVRFLGHWGFQYYLQPAGARPFNRKSPEFVAGDILLAPETDLLLTPVATEKLTPLAKSSFEGVPFVSNFKAGSGAGFYSSFFGPLPWVINRIEPEKYYAFEAR